jgi:hypothetical protein
MPPALHAQPVPRHYTGQSCQAIAAACLRYPLALDQLEREFLDEIHERETLTAMQHNKLTEIAMRLRAKGRAV